MTGLAFTELDAKALYPQAAAVVAAASAEARGPHAALSDVVMAAIHGQRDAQKVLYDLRGGCAAADALHGALQAVLATNDAERLRAFTRELQKAVERAG